MVLDEPRNSDLEFGLRPSSFRISLVHERLSKLILVPTLDDNFHPLFYSPPPSDMSVKRMWRQNRRELEDQVISNDRTSFWCLHLKGGPLYYFNLRVFENNPRTRSMSIKLDIRRMSKTHSTPDHPTTFS